MSYKRIIDKLNLQAMTSTIIYEGNLRTRATHLYSGTEILTDAPLDNQGLAQAFSPTDLVATALGSCIASIMGIKAREMNLNIKGTTLHVNKIMASDPRRIVEVEVQIKFPANQFSDKEKAIFENAAKHCPVAKSLHPDIIQQIDFTW